MTLQDESRQTGNGFVTRSMCLTSLHLAALFCLLAGLSEKVSSGVMAWQWWAAATPLLMAATLLSWRRQAPEAEPVEMDTARLASGDPVSRCGLVYDNQLGVFGAGYMELGYQSEMSRACRHQSPMSLMSVSFDYSRVSGEHGSAAAEQSVKVLAQILRSSLRGSDVICHYEPGEFVILLPETDKHLAETPARRIQVATQQWRLESRRPAPVAVRIGVGDCWDGLSSALRQARTTHLQAVEMAALLQPTARSRPQA